MKSFFEDHGEVEHVIDLTADPDFLPVLADMLRDHGVTAMVPAHLLDGGLPEPPVGLGCDADGYPLDPAHPWNGGPGYAAWNTRLNTRQEAIVEALEAVRSGRGVAAALWALHAVEADAGRAAAAAEVAALVPDAERGRKFPGRKRGAVDQLTRAICAYLDDHPSAKATTVWRALERSPPDGFYFEDNMSSDPTDWIIEKPRRTKSDDEEPPTTKWKSFQQRVKNAKHQKP